MRSAATDLITAISTPSEAGWSGAYQLVGGMADVMFVHFRETLDDLGRVDMRLRRSRPGDAGRNGRVVHQHLRTANQVGELAQDGLQLRADGVRDVGDEALTDGAARCPEARQREDALAGLERAFHDLLRKHLAGEIQVVVSGNQGDFCPAQVKSFLGGG